MYRLVKNFNGGTYWKTIIILYTISNISEYLGTHVFRAWDTSAHNTLLMVIYEKKGYAWCKSVIDALAKQNATVEDYFYMVPFVMLTISVYYFFWAVFKARKELN